MKNYDFIFILACLFVFRVITLSGSYVDAICLTSILGYHLASRVIKDKKLTSEVLVRVEKEREVTQKQMQGLAEEVARARNISEGMKAAVNLTKR